MLESLNESCREMNNKTKDRQCVVSLSYCSNLLKREEVPYKQYKIQTILLFLQADIREKIEKENSSED